MASITNELQQVYEENEALRARLEEAEETLRAIRSGEVDALVVNTTKGNMVFTLRSADHPYRAFLEEMHEGAVTISQQGMILYCNRQFATLLNYPLERIRSSSILDYVSHADREAFSEQLRDTSQNWSHEEINLLDRRGRYVPAYLAVNHMRIDDQTITCLVVTDLREQKKQAEETVFFQHLGLAISQSDDLASALRTILGMMCSKANWAMGEAWIPHASGTKLERVASWCADNNEIIEFDHARQHAHPSAGTGLVGWVWSEKQTLWMGDLTGNPQFEPAEAAHKAGLRTALAVPLMDGQDIVAVLAFYLTHLAERDDHMRSLITSVNLHLGAFIRQKQVEDALRDSEARFKSAFEFSPIGMALVAPTGQWLKVNRRICQMLGYSNDELLQHDFQSLTHPQDLEIDHEKINQALQGEIPGYSAEKRFFHKNGSEVWVNLSVALVRDANNQPLHFVAQIEDISERKHAAQQALELSLERERTRILTDFITSASHEFRTPLSVIQTGLYLLRRAAPEQRAQDRITVIEDEARNITTLVEDLMIMAKLDGDPRMKFDSFQFNPLLPAVVAQVQRLYKHVDVEQQSSDELTIVGDFLEWLQRALKELLENACRYSPEAAQIHVNAFVREHEVMIEVVDQGVGIESKDLARIFERFYRGDTAHTTRGFGLGLPIAQRIIELHRGRIEVNSEPSKGSTFRIILPAM